MGGAIIAVGITAAVARDATIIEMVVKVAASPDTTVSTSAPIVAGQRLTTAAPIDVDRLMTIRKRPRAQSATLQQRDASRGVTADLIVTVTTMPVPRHRRAK